VADIDPIEEVLKHEGGFVNRAEDRGGPTNFGITKAVYEDWIGRPVSIDEIRTMDRNEAKEIYENRYLVGPRISELSDPLQTHILDIAVNSGPKTAIKMLQRVLNMAGFGPVDVDGVLGPKTRQVAENAQIEMGGYLQNAIVEERIKFYNSIVERDPKQAVFIRGWLNRANSFRVTV